MLTDSKWAESSDADLQPAPKCASTSWGGDDNLEVTLDKTAGNGPVIMAGIARDLLDARLEKASTGERQAIGSVRFSTWDEIARQYYNAYSYPYPADGIWTSERAPNPTFNAGFADWLKLGTPSSASGFAVEISTPFAWWGLDLAELLFVFLRFYSGAGVGVLDYLDKAALQAYSLRCVSYLHGPRLWVWRKVGQTLDQQILDLAGQCGAIVSWGGFDNATGLVQRHGLRVLHPRHLEHSTLPPMDLGVGRTAGLQDISQQRTADEFVLNAWRTIWGAFAVTTRIGSEVGETTFEQPAEPVDENNVITVSDSASQAIYGLRNTERAVPNIVEHAHALCSQLPDLWLDRPWYVEVAQGPLHLDYNAGAIVHAQGDREGLDGTEDFLVLHKDINVSKWGAVIQLLQLGKPTQELYAPDGAQLGADLELYLRSDAGVTHHTAGSSELVTAWADQSGAGNDATYSARISAALAASPQLKSNGLNGKDTIDFTSGLAALDFGSMALGSAQYTGRTIVALVKLNGAGAAEQWIMHAANDGTLTKGHGVGWVRSAGSGCWGFMVQDILVEDTRFDAPGTGEWHLLFFTMRPRWPQPMELQSVNEENAPSCDQPNPAGEDRLGFTTTTTLGAYHDATKESLYGELALLASIGRHLLPAEARGLAAWVIDEFGPLA